MNNSILCDQVRRALVGKRLSGTRKSIGLRTFQFGLLRRRAILGATVGETALHIVMSPWRICKGQRIVTGEGDYAVDLSGDPIYLDHSESLEEKVDPNNTLQVQRMRELLPVDTSRPSPSGRTEFFQYPVIDPDFNIVVEEANVNDRGDLEILLTESISIQVFCVGTTGEHWRILYPQDRRRAHLSMIDDGRLVRA